MKKFLSAAVVGTTLAVGSAIAADLPSRMTAPIAPRVYAPIFTWTGFYAGINAGGAWGSGNPCLTAYGFNGQLAGGAVAGYTNWPASYCGSSSGSSRFLGGGQVGYNYQLGAAVFGLEADIDYLGNKKQSSTGLLYYGDPLGPDAAGTVGGANDPYSGYYQVYSNRNKNNYLGTLRLRAGYAMDRTLLFVTGGLAFGGGSGGGYAAYWAQPQAVGGPTGTATAFYGSNAGSGGGQVGWTIGGGVEYAVTDNWTAKFEYLYANFGNGKGLALAPASYTCSALCAAPGSTIALAGDHYFGSSGRNNSLNLLRAGVNYKF
jgi:outer membrane immunogenic protein